MKHHLSLILGLGLLAGVTHAEDASKSKTVFKDEREKASYAIGMNVATGWKGMEGLDVDVDAIVKGIQDTMGGKPTLLNQQECREVLGKFSQELRAKREAKDKELAEKNKKEGAAFLAENGKKAGVITLPSGLQYKVVSEGSGKSPRPEDTVKVNYRGTLIDGTEFDSSEKHGKPLTTRVAGGIIKGWTEALELMKPGAKWQLYIPADLAYGDRRMGPNIGPGSTLVFDIELLEIVPPAPSATSGQPLTSDIIKVPSAEELKKGAKIETIKPEDVEKEKAKSLNKK